MKWIVGIDEVGRGPLAGPVYVCAAAMPEPLYRKMQWGNLRDSKKMTAKARENWYRGAELLAKEGKVRFAVAKRTARAIDAKGIALCIRECVAEALETLSIDPKQCTVLLDGGLKAPVWYSRQQTIIKGDDEHKIISLASVIAKVQRDYAMITLSKKHPQYHWHLNKGYGTAVHRAAIQKWGLTPFHRKSFLKSFGVVEDTPIARAVRQRRR